MKLARLQLHNFRQHTSTNIDFTDGVIGIVGPNGAGKTTILEAIAWVLYGSNALRGNVDSVRSKAAEGGAKASVTLDFELGGTNYQIERSLTPAGSASAVLTVDGRPLRSGTKEVNEAVARLLGMDYRAFFTSFFTAQKELEFMASMDGRARAGAISRMLGYDRLTKARDQANSDRLGLDRQIDGLEKGLPNPEELKERKKEAQAALNEANQLLADSEKERDKWHQTVEKLTPLKELSDEKAKRQEELSRKLEIDNNNASRLETTIKKSESELKALVQKRAEYDTIKNKLAGFREEAEELKNLEALSKHESKRQSLVAQISVLEKDIKALTDQEKKLSKANEAQQRANAALEAAETALQQTETKIQSLREQRVASQNSLDAQIIQLQEQSSEIEANRQRIKEAGAAGKCPTCERPLAGELPTVLANFDAQLKILSDKIEALRAQRAAHKSDNHELIELQKSQQALAEQIKTLRAEKSQADLNASEYSRISAEYKKKSADLSPLRTQLSELPTGFDQKRFDELQQLKESLQSDRDRFHALKGELERQQGLQSDIEANRSQYEAIRQEIDRTKTSLAEIKFSEQDHRKLCTDFETATKQLNQAILNVEKQRGVVNTASAIMQQCSADEESYKSKIELLNETKSNRLHLKTLAESFDKLRTDLNDRIRPELESIASELLTEMTDGRYSTLEINESYSATIRDDGELKPVISGGEDDVVNLALRLAVSQMIADRAGQSYSLLVLDEVFASLDDVRRDNVVSLLQNLKNRFEQIIVITHVEAIHDAVDSCLWVEFNEQTKTCRLIDRSTPADAIEAGLQT